MMNNMADKFKIMQKQNETLLDQKVENVNREQEE